MDAVLVPVKSFGAAKGRLRGFLSDTERRRLARWTADRVLAGAGRHAFVACDDVEVAEWATGHGATVVWGPGLGLNGAVDEAVAGIAAAGYAQVTIAHADLPDPRGLSGIGGAGRRAGSIVVVPDRHRDGTNVLSRPTAVALPAQYGPGSFARHLASALGTGRPVTVRVDPFLSVDIDTADDLRHPAVARLLSRALTERPAA